MFELFDPNADLRIEKGTNLPHWYQPGVSYFVTFRTEDSMPIEVSQLWHAQREDWLKRHGISMADRDWRVRLDRLDVAIRREFHETFSRQYLEALDKGYGACVLRRSELSRVVAKSLLHFNGQRYYMGDFVVMPNHVHLIVCLLGDTEIVAQCTSWKRFTAKEINQLIGKKGRFWQEDSFDHLIRSPEQFTAIQRYIANNPSRLKPGEYHLYQYEAQQASPTTVAGTFHVPSAESRQTLRMAFPETNDQAEGAKERMTEVIGDGTWNVPTTLEDNP